MDHNQQFEEYCTNVVYNIYNVVYNIYNWVWSKKILISIAVLLYWLYELGQLTLEP